MIMELLCQAGETGRERGVKGGGVVRGGGGRGGKDGGLVVSACASGCPRRLYVAIGVVV